MALTAPIAPTLTLVRPETEARGFALYIGIDEATARQAGTSLTQIAAALKQTFANLVPQAADQTYAAVALAPKHAQGRSIDIVRAALQDPRALERLLANNDEPAQGITVDLARKRIYADGELTDVTAKEFELLAYLIQNEGEVISREELIDAIWQGEESDAPNTRTIDVHIRRLRTKITGYEDIIRTVRGNGYRFDTHPDVLIEG